MRIRRLLKGTIWFWMGFWPSEEAHWWFGVDISYSIGRVWFACRYWWVQSSKEITASSIWWILRYLGKLWWRVNHFHRRNCCLRITLDRPVRCWEIALWRRFSWNWLDADSSNPRHQWFHQYPLSHFWSIWVRTFSIQPYLNIPSYSHPIFQFELIWKGSRHQITPLREFTFANQS